MNEMSEIRSDDHEAACTAETEQTYSPTIAGWAARLVSLGLMVTLISAIAYQAVQPDTPVRFSSRIQQEDIRPNGSEYLVPVEMVNEGSQTALNVKAEVVVAGRMTEIEIPMIGQQEAVTYVVTAPQAPKSVTHRIVSYEAP